MRWGCELAFAGAGEATNRLGKLSSSGRPPSPYRISLNPCRAISLIMTTAACA